MTAIISLLIVLVVSLLIVRIATVALTLTGLSKPVARFQARSAFTGTGFTTAESEQVVQHPVRRRIVMLLMLLGNAGIVSAVATSMLSFTGAENTGLFSQNMLVLIAGLFLLWIFATSQWVDNRLSRLIGWALTEFTSIELRDYAGLLHLTGDYIVAELNVNSHDWLCDQELKDLRLSDEGVLVLGIERQDGAYIGAPRGEHRLYANDRLLLYGREEVLSNLDERRRGAAGNREHQESIKRQAELEQGERGVDVIGSAE
ncbi:MAG: TrkA C-terminal domain-containing protein [Planctomycetaceae bacterium]|nr:TrkA C-terminal domain-containing protein [Planctomycetaceae bacterium]